MKHEDSESPQLGMCIVRLLPYLPALLEEANRHWLDELVRSLKIGQKVHGL